MPNPTKYFLVMDYIDVKVTKSDLEKGSLLGNESSFKVEAFKKGDLGVFLGPGFKNGTIKARKLNSSQVFEIPYAPAFIKFIGNDLDLAQTLYGDYDDELEIN